MADQIIANIERLNQLMDENECSAVVARSGKNFTYLAGFAYPGTLARHLDFPDSPRGVLVVWPRHGDPVLVANDISAPLARRDGWIENVQVYDGYAESPYVRTADILKDIGLGNEKIGLEKDYLSALQWEEMVSQLPKANLMDCSEMMDRVRWIKTSAEVEMLEKGANLLDEAYLEVFPTVRPGDTEREVHSRIIESCIRRGAGWAHGILNTSRNDVAYGGEGDMALRPVTLSEMTTFPISMVTRATSPERWWSANPVESWLVPTTFTGTSTVQPSIIAVREPEHRTSITLLARPSVMLESRGRSTSLAMVLALGGTSRSRTWFLLAGTPWRREWWSLWNLTSATGICKTWS